MIYWKTKVERSLGDLAFLLFVALIYQNTSNLSRNVSQGFDESFPSYFCISLLSFFSIFDIALKNKAFKCCFKKFD